MGQPQNYGSWQKGSRLKAKYHGLTAKNAENAKNLTAKYAKHAKRMGLGARRSVFFAVNFSLRFAVFRG